MARSHGNGLGVGTVHRVATVNNNVGRGCAVGALWVLAVLIAAALSAIPAVGPFLGLLALAGAGFAHWSMRRAAAESDSGTAQPDGVATSAPAVVATEGPAVMLMSRGRQGVAGEAYNRAAIARVVGRRRIALAGDWDSGLEVTALLRREPSNRHDANAVRVELIGAAGPGKAGYLPADVAPAWRTALMEIERQGAVAACRARVFRGGNARGDFVVVLRLAPPERALALNAPPAGAVLLEPERECAVTGENKHQDAIGPRLGPVWATLHAAQVESGGSAGAETLEVRIDGRRVGVLTAAQGARYVPLLSRGQVVVCEGEVFRGRTAVEVRLFLPRVD